jgi:hypothetical protein
LSNGKSAAEDGDRLVVPLTGPVGDSANRRHQAHHLGAFILMERGTDAVIAIGDDKGPHPWRHFPEPTGWATRLQNASSVAELIDTGEAMSHLIDALAETTNETEAKDEQRGLL